MSFYDFAKDFAGPLVGAAATIIAWRTFRQTRAVASKRATLDLICQLAKDSHYNEALGKIRKMRRDSVDSGTLLTELRRKDGTLAEQDLRRERYEAARTVLNALSIYANGIRSGALDEQSFKDYYYSTYVEIVGSLGGLIESIRVQAKKVIKESKHVSADTLYSELIWLQERWKNAPLTLNPKKTNWPRFWN